MDVSDFRYETPQDGRLCSRNPMYRMAVQFLTRQTISLARNIITSVVSGVFYHQNRHSIDLSHLLNPFNLNARLHPSSSSRGRCHIRGRFTEPGRSKKGGLGVPYLTRQSLATIIVPTCAPVELSLCPSLATQLAEGYRMLLWPLPGRCVNLPCLYPPTLVPYVCPEGFDGSWMTSRERCCVKFHVM